MVLTIENSDRLIMSPFLRSGLAAGSDAMVVQRFHSSVRVQSPMTYREARREDTRFCEAAAHDTARRRFAVRREAVVAVLLISLQTGRNRIGFHNSTRSKVSASRGSPDA
jgi:hypothetical protein